ncbi:MAG: hypothetical protein HGA97_12090 [Chlorobiaceae bacterium]|nr:hypothetical protein [Chlorobiaceae bacterium]
MQHEVIDIAEPVQKAILIGSAVISLALGFWALLKGRGSETEHEYYGTKETPKSDKPEE